MNCINLANAAQLNIIYRWIVYLFLMVLIGVI